MNKKSLWKIILALVVFSPLAFLPAASRAALLTSRAHPVSQDREEIRELAVEVLTEDGISRDNAEKILNRLSPREIEVLALSRTGSLVGAGSGGISESLGTNETVAIVLTLVMLAVVVGAVEISRH